uniref:alpha-L-fucosidase n=1 Tax=Acrobeloides nanus TaxID=290746 RepID=A0A914CSZ8_9BILA
MNSSYWRSTEFLAWLYNESPVKDTVVTNDRWGGDTPCKHGGYYTCVDRYLPGTLQTHKWEDADTLDYSSWGYRRTMGVRGNYLLNFGPDHNGRVLPIFEERLRGIGSFVNAHNEAIFATKPWIFQNDSDSTIWYTSQVRNDTGLDPYRLYNNQTQDNTIIYAFVLEWPIDNLVNLQLVIPTTKTTVNLFGSNGQNITLPWTQPFQLNGGIQIDITGVSLNKFPSTDAFVLKIEYAADQN